MGFWAYMLHCADRSFYVGHTDDLEARIGVHQSGLIPGYTATRLPAKLVWADEFPTRYEALQAERQLKGWSRAKKLALIRGDWPLISRLAHGSKDQGRASTGSARTDLDTRT
jgi:predicted GIY-YIG superfamily endonuclease